MQFAHAPVAITFAVHISPHVSKSESGPNHPMHMPKLVGSKYFDI